MKSNFKKLIIGKNVTIKNAIYRLNNTGRKCLIVVQNKKLLGTLSDGDLRKAIIKGGSLKTKITNLYNKNPITLPINDFKSDTAKKLFIKNHIDLIPITNEKNEIMDVLFWETETKNTNKILKNQVVIMAGGKGTRLLPFTQVLPKPLIPIGENTVIETIINKFFNYGLKHYYLIVNYKSKILKAYFEELSPKYKYEFVNEVKPLGTIGGIKKLKNKFKNDFFVTNCDIVVDADYQDIIKFHKLKNNDITIIVSTKAQILPYGVCKIDNNGQLEELIEKPELDFLINVGLYVMKPSILNLIPANKYFDFPDLIKVAKNNYKKIGIYPIYDNKWFDIGQWSEYQRSLRKIKM